MLIAFTLFFFFQAEDGIRDLTVTGVQTCALPIKSLNSILASSRARTRFSKAMSCRADCRCGRGILSSALGGLRRGPGALGLVAEDRLHLGALEGPVASCDLRLELTRCPAGVADEDPQTVHGIVAAKQPQQQLPVRAQVDSVTGLDRVLGR